MINKGPIKQELQVEFFHKSFYIPIIVEYFYTPEEKATSDCPGSDEEFEIVGINIANSIKRGISHVNHDFLEEIKEEFGPEIDLIRLSHWFEGLEENAIKAFHKEIERNRKNKEI